MTEPKIPFRQTDLKYLWHPFTQMQEWEREDFPTIVRGEGIYLIDEMGKRYIDGVSSLWCNVHGHNHPKITQAIQTQAAKLDHSTLLGLTHPPAIRLAEMLANIAPEGLTRVFFSESGASAVEIALKIAFQYQAQRTPPRPEKNKFIALKEAYHGDTIGAASVGGINLFHETYKPLLFDTIQLDSPSAHNQSMDIDLREWEYRSIRKMEEAVRQNADETAAFIIEPLIQGAGGMLIAPEGYLRQASRVCKECDVLLIADEVATGFGRTGKMWACEHESVTPDLMVIAKGITGGVLPLAATLSKEKIYKSFLGDYGSMRTFFHGHTYTGNPIACAAAIANLEIFEEEKTLEKVPGKIRLLIEELDQMRSHPHVGDIRQYGFMVGIELIANKKIKNPYPFEQRIGHQVTLEARKRGLIIRPLGDVIVLMPPLTTPNEVLREIVQTTRESINAVIGKE